MSAKLAKMTETAEKAVQEALSTEARTHDGSGSVGDAEIRAFMALDRIADLAYYAKSLEDRLAETEAKLLDAIDAEAQNAMWAEEDARS